MTKSQKWLDKEYPKEKRRKLIELDISNQNLESHLELEGFNNLKELNCTNNKIASLDISKLNKLREIHCSTNQIYYLKIGNKVKNIQKFCCFDNNLSNLEINNLTNLEYFDCSNNQLNDINLTNLNPRKLTYLDISNNDFSSRDLTNFTKLVNLEYLSIGNDNKERIEKGVYNRFYGSLEPLKNLVKLRTLYIPATDIDSGLEYLTDTIGTINCSSYNRPDS